MRHAGPPCATAIGMADPVRLVPFIFVLVLLGVATGRAASADDRRPSDPSAVVWCYDEGLSIVSRKQAWRCRGRIVGDREAEEIQNRRIRRIIDGFEKPKPLFDGTRLSGSGTGFYVSTVGHVVTNHHVVDDCKGISFTPAGADALVATLVTSDTAIDLALLHTAGRQTIAAPFRDPPRVDGDEEFAVVGYPLHGRVTIKPVMVTGRLYFGKGNPGRNRFAMKIDIRRGNSGGPVLDRRGRVAGVVVAKVNTPHVFATTGQIMRDIGVAIRPSLVVRFLRANNVDIVTSSTGAAMTDEALFDHAHRFVGQVGCWR